MSRHDNLRPLAADKSAAERYAFGAFRLAGYFQRQRRARVPMPDFDRVNAMPVRAFSGCEQKINCGRCRAITVDLSRVAKNFAKMTAFRMRLEIKQPDDVAGR